MSPLRLDVLVRAALFRTWFDAWDVVGDDPDAAFEIARDHPYRTWFDAVAADKIVGSDARGGDERDGELGQGDHGDRDEAFAWRVKRSHRLLARFIAYGFDTRHPVTVRFNPGGTIESGKTLGPRWYPVDGCHRLALLWLDGVREIEPVHYRILTDRVEPRDNTARLLPLLELDDASYYEYIGLGYGFGSASTEQELLEAVSTNPEVVAEVNSVLSSDRAVRS